MRTLIYVPIIHTSADLGSLSEEIKKRGVADLGEEVWAIHTKTIEGFWDAIAAYVNFISVGGIKIYQDGMIMGGEIGNKIVEEGVKAGSKNYKIISNLLKKGAVLVNTEDFNLVKKERDKLLSITQSKTITPKLFALLKYKLTKNQLLNQRDKFIAKRIIETLNPGERGIIFIGAYHNIKEKLPKDIQIIEIKDIEKVRAYQKLWPFYHRYKERIAELSKFLVSEIKIRNI